MTDDVHIGARSVQIETEAVIIAKPAKAPSKGERWLYGVNAFAFALTMVLLTVWFDAHLESYFTHLAVLGTVTLFAIAEMLVSWKDLLFKSEKIREKFLAQSTTSFYIAALLIAATVLLAMTKSVYVKLGKTDASKVLVEVRDETKTNVIDTLRLDEEHRIAGRPMFFTLAPQNVWLIATEPKGYEDVLMKVSWRSEPQTFPFTPKHYHIMRILPSIQAKQQLPDEDEQGATVTVTVDSIVYSIPNFHKSDIAYIGASADEIRYVRMKHQDEFEKEYKRLLILGRITDDTQMKIHMAEIGKTVHDQATIEPKNAVEAKIQNGNLLFTGRRAIKKDAPEIESIYVERQ